MNELAITVRHSGTLSRRVAADARGVLTAIEGKDVPFPIQRAYTVSGVPDASLTRGLHAHKKTDQALFVIQGALTLVLDDGTTTQELRLTSEDPGIRLGPLLWHSMKEFSEDCVALVLASLPYDESDYLRDYEEFKRYVSTI